MDATQLQEARAQVQADRQARKARLQAKETVLKPALAAIAWAWVEGDEATAIRRVLQSVGAAEVSLFKVPGGGFALLSDEVGLRVGRRGAANYGIHETITSDTSLTNFVSVEELQKLVAGLESGTVQKALRTALKPLILKHLDAQRVAAVLREHGL